eukprot:CFRG1673T1
MDHSESTVRTGVSGRQQQIDKSRNELIRNTVAAGISSGIAVGMFNPLDCLRVRFQMESKDPSIRMNQLFRRVIAKEGLFRGLWIPGLGSNMTCFTFISGLRYGLYPLVRDTTSHMCGEQQKSAVSMFISGFSVGAFAFAIGMPFYQAKTLLQVESGLVNNKGILTTGARKGHPREYTNLVQVLRKISSSRGFSGLFRGFQPCVARGSLLSAGQTTSYDYTKTYILKHELLQQGPSMHVLCSVISAFCAASLSAPADIVGTRWQTAPLMGKSYTSLQNCVMTMAREEGISVFMRGWSMLFVRLVPVFCVSVPVYEEIRRRLGIGYLD